MLTVIWNKSIPHPGVLNPEGNPTARLDLVANAQVARLTAEEFDTERAKMIKACNKCHSENFAKASHGVRVITLRVFTLTPNLLL